MTNLVVGKFYPPHLGHHYLIETALADGPTVVLILWSEQESISVTKRGRWLRDYHPNDAMIIGQVDEYPVDYESDEAWANHIGVMKHALRGYDIDRVYGSEPYVERLASYFDAVPVIVDIDRRTVPTSGTAVRADVRGNWTFLSPPVRAGLAKRIVCVGAESCGTTTLARDLAAHYHTVWVPEYGRLYTEGIGQSSWTHHDLCHIAKVQRNLEASLALHAEGGFLICDTNTLATRIWDEFLVGPSAIHADPADLFILTDLCPWEDDGLRHGEFMRHDMQVIFRDYLSSSSSPWIEVTGTPQARVQQAVERIDNLTWKFANPLG